MFIKTVNADKYHKTIAMTNWRSTKTWKQNNGFGNIRPANRLTVFATPKSEHFSMNTGHRKHKSTHRIPPFVDTIKHSEVTLERIAFTSEINLVCFWFVFIEPAFFSIRTSIATLTARVSLSLVSLGPRRTTGTHPKRNPSCERRLDAPHAFVHGVVLST